MAKVGTSAQQQTRNWLHSHAKFYPALRGDRVFDVLVRAEDHHHHYCPVFTEDVKTFYNDRNGYRFHCQGHAAKPWTQITPVLKVQHQKLWHPSANPTPCWMFMYELRQLKKERWRTLWVWICWGQWARYKCLEGFRQLLLSNWIFFRAGGLKERAATCRHYWWVLTAIKSILQNIIPCIWFKCSKYMQFQLEEKGRNE